VFATVRSLCAPSAHTKLQHVSGSMTSVQMSYNPYKQAAFSMNYGNMNGKVFQLPIFNSYLTLSPVRVKSGNICKRRGATSEPLGQTLSLLHTNIHVTLYFHVCVKLHIRKRNVHNVQEVSCIQLYINLPPTQLPPISP
jgi:hypothetical protein